MSSFALKGNIVYSKSSKELVVFENHYVVCEDGICKGVYQEVPEGIVDIIDYADRLIMPGMSDIHLHAPQYVFRGLGMDMELLDWLNTYTFPEEGKYSDIEYARRAYEIFVDDLKKSGTTRVCVFATIHDDATELLMELLEESGLAGYVGKVSMDRNAPDYLCEQDAYQAVVDFVNVTKDRYQNIKPILTPRFTPSCTDELMERIGKIQKETGCPLQSHLSENKSEIAWVQELSPDSTCYADAYDRLGAFGSNGKTVMAHCVYSTQEEVELMKKRGVFVAHCPQSNTNLLSGIAPVKRYLEEGLNIGLGSDIAGGDNISLFAAMREAIKVSKLRWVLEDKQYGSLSEREAFYLATKGGGAFFGKVGSFEEGYEFDAIVLDDSNIKSPYELSVEDRMTRLIYLADDRNVVDVYVRGSKLK